MNDLERVVKLANLLVEQQGKVQDLEAQLKEAKANALRTEREDLPELMAECGLKSFTLEDGSSVQVKEEVEAAITELTRDRAMAWLTDNDFGGLIKTSVTVLFDRGEHEAARELALHLQSDYGRAEMKEVVHPATLKSFVKEQLAAGEPLPLDVFNVRPFNVAKITKGKK